MVVTNSRLVLINGERVATVSRVSEQLSSKQIDRGLPSVYLCFAATSCKIFFEKLAETLVPTSAARTVRGMDTLLDYETVVRLVGFVLDQIGESNHPARPKWKDGVTYAKAWWKAKRKHKKK